VSSCARQRTMSFVPQERIAYQYPADGMEWDAGKRLQKRLQVRPRLPWLARE
jgi:hypothetical protein